LKTVFLPHPHFFFDEEKRKKGEILNFDSIFESLMPFIEQFDETLILAKNISGVRFNFMLYHILKIK